MLRSVKDMYMHVHVCAHVGAYICMCVPVCGGQNSISVVFLCFYPSLFSELESLTDLEFMHSARLASVLQVSTHLGLPSTWNTDMCHQSQFFVYM